MSNPAKPAHTPGPWRVEYRSGAAAMMYGHCIASSFYSKPGVTDGRDAIAEVRGGENAETAKANAAFIVRACNAYDDLVAALRNVVADADRYLMEGSMQPIRASTVSKARAALAKAEA